MIKQIKLLSHASVIIKINDVQILTDPWFIEKAFNDGWSLLPAPDLEEIRRDLIDIKIIWISHEHPDHLHFPTLKLIKNFVSPDVKIIFQKTGTRKVFEALKKIGYNNFFEIKHMEKFKLSEDVEISVYSHRHLDSALAVFVKNKFWLLNINDCELNESDTRIINKKWGNVDILLNQFSIAGSNGIEHTLENEAIEVRNKMVTHHRQLHAKITIPFASFVYFSVRDNCYINNYINTPQKIVDEFIKNGYDIFFLYPQTGIYECLDDNILPNNFHERNEDTKSKLISLFEKHNLFRSIDEVSSYPKEQVIEVLILRITNLKKQTNSFLWKKITPIIFRINDWNDEHWRLDFQNVSFVNLNTDLFYDIEINSQPLYFAFKMPFGVQTLGVSGRYKFHPEYKKVPINWKILRMITSLENANIYLNLWSLFQFSTLNWIWIRRKGLFGQILQQFNRFSFFSKNDNF
jgi:UDP-MurNAc hydroxylase